MRPLRFPYLLHQPLQPLIFVHATLIPLLNPSSRPPTPENEGDDRENLKRILEGLPPNPRDWSKGELGTYLKEALRVQSANGQGGCP